MLSGLSLPANHSEEHIGVAVVPRRHESGENTAPPGSEAMRTIAASHIRSSATTSIRWKLARGHELRHQSVHISSLLAVYTTGLSDCVVIMRAATNQWRGV
jgi:hypothetical protein